MTVIGSGSPGAIPTAPPTAPSIDLDPEARLSADLQWNTIGDWATEAESASAFDARIELAGLFHVYREVPGTLTHPRPGQVDKTVRIDRVLVPNDQLIRSGWGFGAIGIEIKRSNVRIGPPLAQAVDYVRSVWLIRGIYVQLGAVFIWPMAKQFGPLASVMVNSRVGSASFSPWSTVHLQLGNENVLRFAHGSARRVEIGSSISGRKVGSR